MKQHILPIVGACAMMFGLIGCDPVTISTTVGGIVGITAMEERPLDVNYTDRSIQLNIHSGISAENLAPQSDISTLVYQGEVMLVGYAKTEEVKRRIVELTTNISGVQRIYDELSLNAVDSATYVNDSLLGVTIRTKLSLEKGVHAVNYVIRIYDGIVYAMGLALSQEEDDRVRTVISSINGVRGLVSHVKTKTPDTIIPDQGSSVDVTAILSVQPLFFSKETVQS